MTEFKKQSAAVAVAVLLGLGATEAAAVAATVVVPGVETLTGVAVLDWAPANVIAFNGNQAVADFLNTQGTCANTATGCVFDTFLHGTLSAFQDSANTTILSTVGTNYEVTFELGFSEKVIGARLGAITDANFGFGPSGKTTGPYLPADLLLSNGAPDFFRMYLDTTVNANALQGSGYGDGALLFSGTVAPVAGFSSNFTNTGSGILGGANSITPTPAWDGVTSVHGTGSTSPLDLFITGALTAAGSDFFGGADLLSLLLSNIGQLLNYTTVDPSLFFPEGSVVNATNPIDAKSVVGPINGGLAFVDGAFVPSNSSVIFQSDTNSPLQVQVPEPETLALMSLGLLGFGLRRRRVVKK